MKSSFELYIKLVAQNVEGFTLVVKIIMLCVSIIGEDDIFFVKCLFFFDQAQIHRNDRKVIKVEI